MSVADVESAMRRTIDFFRAAAAGLTAGGFGSLEEIDRATLSALTSEQLARELAAINPRLAINRYPNGYPRLIPRGVYDGDSIKRGSEGVQVTASQRRRGWQRHNPEAGWLVVAEFSTGERSSPQPLEFQRVSAAYLSAEDWVRSERRAGSRRTATAEVRRGASARLAANWIFDASRR